MHLIGMLTTYEDRDWLEGALETLVQLDGALIVEGAYQETIRLGKLPRSQDGTRELCRAYADKYPSFHYIHANEESDKEQRNFALSKIKQLWPGPDTVVLIVDGDEEYTKEQIREIRRWAQWLVSQSQYLCGLIWSKVYVADGSWTPHIFPRLFRISPGCHFINDNYIYWPEKDFSIIRGDIEEGRQKLLPMSLATTHHSYQRQKGKFELKKAWWESRGHTFPWEWGRVGAERKGIPTYRENTAIREDTTMSIPAYWHGLANSNFGDILTPLLIEAISGEKAVFAPLEQKGKVLVCGSIIQAARDEDVLWGTGTLHPGQIAGTLPKFSCSMVRGPLTRDCLRNAGQTVPDFCGEPSTLLPYIYDLSKIKKKSRLSIFPHICFYRGFLEKKIPYRVCNVGGGVEQVLIEIAQAESLVTESLHVLIVAESFGIPTILMQTTTDHDYDFMWKFRDYYMETDREFIPPILWNSSFREEAITERLSRWQAPKRPDFSRMLACCPFNLRGITSPEQCLRLGSFQNEGQ